MSKKSNKKNKSKNSNKPQNKNVNNKSVQNNSVANKPVQNNNVNNKPVQNNNVNNKPVQNNNVNNKPVQNNSVANKPVQNNSVANKPVQNNNVKSKIKDIFDKNEIAKNTAILTTITLCSGLFVGFVYELTKGPIAMAKAGAAQEAYKEVFADAKNILPYTDFDATKAKELLDNAGFVDDTIVEVLVANDGNNELGHVMSVTAHNGYGGDITFAIGITLDGNVNGIKMLTINETPGLGMNATNEEFTSKFANKKAQMFNVTKSGSTNESEIDAISGATITTEAIVTGVNAALEYWGSITGNVVEGEIKAIVEPEPVAVESSAIYKALFADADNFAVYNNFDANAQEILSSAGFTKDTIKEVVLAKSGETEMGHIITVVAHDGFTGDITFAIGVTTEGTVVGIEMVINNETPGLGLKASDEEFTSKFTNLPVQTFSVTKEGSTSESEIDAISGATITSDAVVNGVNAGLEYWGALKDGVTEGEFSPLVLEEPAADTSEVYKVLFADADNFSAYTGFDIKAEEILDSAGFTKNSITELILAKNGDEEIGHVINVTAHDGFAGDIEFVVGITNDGVITGIEMVTSNETPGLGLKASDKEFTSKFVNVPIQELSVTKEGSTSDSEIDAIAGATITTEAIVNGVNAAVEYWGALKDGATEGASLVIEEPSASVEYPTLFTDADTFTVDESFNVDDTKKLLADAGFSKDTITEVLSVASGDVSLGKVVKVTAHDGFTGDIEFVVGITNDGVITGIEIVTSNETPGLGLKASDKEFTSKFVNVPMQELSVTKEGSTNESEIDAIAGATITTEAIVNGVNAVAKYWATLTGGAINE
ncbi:hypothetical protein AN639_02075 [Candidatus Epulonipiscium fishelsonii]|nr:hypothetical protein AN639_02075 [Epulopiscium sp. SCG-B05WGA-EpuloA1]